MRISYLAVVGSLSVGAIVGCGKQAEPGMTTTTGVPAPIANQSAIQQISTARCNREQACSNIGPGRSYENADICKQKLEYDTRATLRQQDCPNGVGQGELSRCLDDIRNETCGNALDTIARLASCSRSNLCR